MQLGLRRVTVLLVVSGVILTACGSHTGSTPTPKPTPTTKTSTAVGVEVSGAFGSAPKLTVPATAAPATLTEQVISQGTDAAVAKGDTLIANYTGQTWAPKDGKVNVFDSSFARGAAAAFVIGSGQVIPGWDKTLVGKKLGSRVLLTVPPVDGYGTTGQSSAGITGTDTLVFVVDLVASYKPDASAPGTVVPNLPSQGLPKLVNVAGVKPVIVSTAGVTIPNTPISTLLVAGRGAKIDPAKMLVVQFVQTDLATGTSTQATWGRGPATLPAKNAVKLADKLTGQNVGSRVVVDLPPTAEIPASATQQAQPAAEAQVLVIDVVGQF